MTKPILPSLFLSLALSSGVFAQAGAAPVVRALSEHEGVVALGISRPDTPVGGRVAIHDFPLPGGRQVALEMTRVEAFAPGARVVVVRDGAEQAVAIPSMTLLSGRVLGDENSRASLAMTDRGTQGFIQHDGRLYLVSSGKPGAGLATVVFDAARLPAGALAAGHCAVEGGVGHIPGMESPAPTGVQNQSRGEPPCRVADIAVETDREFLRDIFGDDESAATAYVAALFVAISDIYHNELNVHFRVTYLRLWDSNDPWTQGDTVNQLFQWQDHWNAKMTGVARTAAHFLSGRGLGGGVAYVNALCYPEYDYGLSANLDGFFPYPIEDHRSENWDLMVVAHELGHNFGTGHTHDQNSYNPIIDGCGNGDCSDAFNGTIMSYCHTCPGGMTNINLRFGPRVSERILDFLANEAPCDIMAAEATIEEHPHSQSVYENGTAKFSVAASGADTYQWRRNESPIDGANTPFLVFSNVQRTDAGSYDVVVTSECASIVSDAAILTVLCRTDFNGDGFVNGIDFDLFVGAFESGSMSADFDGDGFITGIDFDLYVYAFEEPC